MRPCRPLVVLMIAATLAGCATAPAPEMAAGPGDIDSFIYGSRRGLPAPPPPVIAPGPGGVAVPIPPPMPSPMPVAVPPPLVPASTVMPELVPPDEPYTLDS